MKEYIQMGSLFSSEDEISVYEFFWTNTGSKKGDLICKWKSQDIINMLKEYKSLNEVNDFGFKIHHVKCEITEFIHDNQKLKDVKWKISYSVYRSGFMGGGTLEVEDMYIKMRDIKLKSLL